MSVCRTVGKYCVYVLNQITKRKSGGRLPTATSRCFASGTGFWFATTKAFAVIAAGAVAGLATVATLAVFTAFASISATAGRLCLAGCRFWTFAARDRFVSVTTAHGTDIRTAGQGNGQREECHDGNSEDNMILGHDKFPFDKMVECTIRHRV